MLCCFADGLYHENWDVMTPEPTVRAVPRNREIGVLPRGWPMGVSGEQDLGGVGARSE
jgi:hypothetical protein